MGLIKAAAGAFGGTMADQWKEFFYCDAIDKDVLVVKGEKRVGGRSSNKKGSDNIISSGSGIAVADGQCMISGWMIKGGMMYTNFPKGRTHTPSSTKRFCM